MTNPENQSSKDFDEQNDWIAATNQASRDAVQRFLKESKERQLTIKKLVSALNEKTVPMSMTYTMTELPEFQEMMNLGEGAFTYIIDDKANFSHWHSVMTQYIARDIGEQIEFPNDIRTNVTAVFNFVVTWLENRSERDTPKSL